MADTGVYTHIPVTSWIGYWAVTVTPIHIKISLVPIDLSS